MEEEILKCTKITKTTIKNGGLAVQEAKLSILQAIDQTMP